MKSLRFFLVGELCFARPDYSFLFTSFDTLMSCFGPYGRVSYGWLLFNFFSLQIQPCWIADAVLEWRRQALHQYMSGYKDRDERAEYGWKFYLATTHYSETRLLDV